MVRLLEDICTKLGYKFHYGNKSHLNLIDQNGNLEPNKIHLLLFPVTRGNKDFSNSSRVYSGNFFFVMPDEFANHYEQKYTTKIEPLEGALALLEERLSYCENIDVVQLNSIDAVDVLDANMSGLWVTYQFRLYE